MKHLAIRVENLGKRYRIQSPDKQPQTFREAMGMVLRAPFGYLRDSLRAPTEAEILWALREIAFEVAQGEVVGIIGRNGAGKSTLLKILSRIMEPTEGRAVVRGRVGSLLEVGTGFHPELSGRENVFLNGAILGMSRREINRKFDEIVDFSEIEKFIDTPVKRYSSGMGVRLAFSVAAHLDAEIMIVDEVLSVGDTAFRRKCQDKMSSIARSGRTILFVSHNMNALQALCPRCIWLSHGRIVGDDTSETIVMDYLEAMHELEGGAALVSSWDGDFVLEQARLLGADGRVADTFAPGDSLTVEVNYNAKRRYERPYVWVSVAGHTGTLFAASMLLDGNRPAVLEGSGTLRCTFHQVPLMPRQQFTVQMGALEGDSYSVIIPRTNLGEFSMTGTLDSLGLSGALAARAVRIAAPVVVPYTWGLPGGAQAVVAPRRLSSVP